ncbi:MAG TPA: ATP-binding protein [Burkholderiaceae bacterium]|jgi:two-component system OmpR family sensor kinase|nr:ATP-binding protein [Burkholderiaceae bacterium]
MDGKQTRLTASLQFRLALVLAIVIAIAAVIAGAMGFQSAFRDANELQDDQLREIAAMVDGNLLKLGQIDPVTRSEEEDPESHVAFQLLDDAANANETSTESGVAFPHGLQNGLQTVTANHQDWRVFVKPLHSGKRLAIGQQTAVRDEIAEHAGMRTIMPMMFLIPFLILLVIVVLRILLAPINKLSREIDRRAQMDTVPLDERGLPTELKPFVASINHMLQRLEAAMDQQRRFVADAAHELRSPLTALSLQVENLAINELPAEARIQLNAMNSGLMRARTLVGQLLLLARAQLARPSLPSAIVLQSIAREVFEDIMPFAETKQIDLGLAQGSEVRVMANAVDLNTIIRNLVDNAIRYSAPNSRVDVRLFEQGKWAVVEVQDTGPGIPESEYSKVFDPFYRLPGNTESGSGLGLSIVKSIVSRLSGEVSMSGDSLQHASGSTFIVKLPIYQP